MWLRGCYTLSAYLLFGANKTVYSERADFLLLFFVFLLKATAEQNYQFS